MNKPLLKSIALVTALAQVSAHAAPVLEITRQGNNIQLKWPAASSDWYAQISNTLPSYSWMPVHIDPVVNSGNNVITYPLLGKSNFFRLALKDTPDANYTDANGDGIDGDIYAAVFVSANGSDNNPGTRWQPMATLQAAMNKASLQKKDVYAGKGTYTIAGSLNLLAGVSLYGGFDPANNWKRAAGNTTTISAGSTALIAQGLLGETHVEGFTIKAANAAGAGDSSIGVRATFCSGPLILRYNTIIAGSGAAGSAGSAGADGAPGGNGGNGGVGYMDYGFQPGYGGAAGTSPAGNSGGKGGTGGADPTYNGSAGSAGSGGAAGGSGGAGGDPGGPGQNGAPGANGNHGTSGAGGISFGSVTAGGYSERNGNGGTAGTAGHGGGGGGGGGGQDCFVCDNGEGNGGGGGGGGGTGGNAGGPGGGGGGSFAVLTYSSTVTIESCPLTTGTGGAGGKGGNGGQPGPGGSKGVGPSWGVAENELGKAGDGGKGGDGGRGGNGGGGGGGPSIGIVKSGGTVNITNNSYNIGAGGAGGPGGSNGGQSFSGAQGLSATVK